MARFLLFLLLVVATFEPLVAQVHLCVPREGEPVGSGKPHNLIRHVLFENAPELSVNARTKIRAAVRGHEFDGTLTAQDLQQLTDETAERVRAAYQDEGYFKAGIEGTSIPVAGDPLNRYDISVRVIDPGKQYRLGELAFTKSSQFSVSEMRTLFPVARGAIFKRNKIVEGLENLRRLYDSRGYVNFISVPNTQFDESTATINLAIDIDEGKQFRVGTIEVLGLHPDDEARFLNRIHVKPNDIYTSKALKELPASIAASDPWMVQKRLDERDGLVDFVIDLRPKVICPSPNAPCEVNGRFQSCSDWF